MKKNLILCLLLFTVCSAFAQKGSYMIKGEIENCKDTLVSMTIWGPNGTTSDKMPMKNGHFVLSGETADPLMVRIEFTDRGIYKYTSDGGYIPFKCSSLWVMVYPGANAVVKGKLTDFVDAYPSGDKENDILRSVTSVIFPMMNRCGNIRVQMETEPNTPKELADENRKLDDKITQELKKFVTTYPSSYAAVWFMDDMLLRRQLSPEEAQVLIGKVDAKYRNNEWFRSVTKRIESVQYVIGAQLPEIATSLTPDNTKFSSYSLRGKYLLIDFWGTWCGPCMGGMDAMRSFRDKHKEKLEILGIAKDDKTGWISSIKNKNLNWIHILNGKGEEDFVAKFNVTGFPTKILISPTGVILYRESGESEAFYEKVEEIMKNELSLSDKK